MIGLILALAISSEQPDFDVPAQVPVYFPRHKTYLTPETTEALILVVAGAKVTGKPVTVYIAHFPGEKINIDLDKVRIQNVNWFMKMHDLNKPGIE